MPSKCRLGIRQIRSKCCPNVLNVIREKMNLLSSYVNKFIRSSNSKLGTPNDKNITLGSFGEFYLSTAATALKWNKGDLMFDVRDLCCCLFCQRKSAEHKVYLTETDSYSQTRSIFWKYLLFVKHCRNLMCYQDFVLRNKNRGVAVVNPPMFSTIPQSELNVYLFNDPHYSVSSEAS